MAIIYRSTEIITEFYNRAYAYRAEFFALLFSPDTVSYLSSTVINKGQRREFLKKRLFALLRFFPGFGSVLRLLIFDQVKLILSTCEYAAVGNKFIFLITSDSVHSSEAGHSRGHQSFVGAYPPETST